MDVGYIKGGAFSPPFTSNININRLFYYEIKSNAMKRTNEERDYFIEFFKNKYRGKILVRNYGYTRGYAILRDVTYIGGDEDSFIVTLCTINSGNCGSIIMNTDELDRDYTIYSRDELEDELRRDLNLVEIHISSKRE